MDEQENPQAKTTGKPKIEGGPALDESAGATPPDDGSGSETGGEEQPAETPDDGAAEQEPVENPEPEKPQSEVVQVKDDQDRIIALVTPQSALVNIGGDPNIWFEAYAKLRSQCYNPERETPDGQHLLLFRQDEVAHQAPAAGQPVRQQGAQMPQATAPGVEAPAGLPATELNQFMG